MNKKLLLTLLAAVSAVVPSFAQLNGDGYYRVQNNYTGRYITIIDNKSNTELATTEPDLGAIRTIKSFATVSSSPSSIVYIKYMSTSEGRNYYNLYGQGTDIYSIIKYNIVIDQVDRGYRAYGIYSGSIIFLSDYVDPSYEDAPLNTIEASTRYWNILPVSSSSDNYFCINPTITANGKHYATLYADFAIKAISDDMKFYYPASIYNGSVYCLELTSGVVPAQTPVIIECSSSEMTSNKVDIVSTSESAPASNQLKGVLFNNYAPKHVNLTEYDANTMRVLGTTSDGSLGFITTTASALKNGSIAANTAYLSVPEGTASELKLEFATAGISGVEADKQATDIYTLTGVKVRSNTTSTEGLQPGVYIVGKKKVVVQ